MSAPTSHDPLVVNTRDGVCWERRAVTPDGRGLYAVEGSCKCPEFVMATLAELAEHGIVGSAHVLPVPQGPGPQSSPEGADRAKAPWGRGEDGRPLLPMGAHWTDVPELVDRRLADVQARVDQAQSGGWYVAPGTALSGSGTVYTRVEGYQRTVGQFTNVLPADLELILRAHDDLSWLLEMVAKFRARVAGLESERHSTNESLDVAIGELRWREGRSGAGCSHGLCDPSRPFAQCPVCGVLRNLPETGDAEEWCTGCNTDHDPAECGYRLGGEGGAS